MELLFLCISCAGLFDTLPDNPRCRLCDGRLVRVTREQVEDSGLTVEQLISATAEAKAGE